MSWGVALRNAVGLGLGGIPSLLNAPPYARLAFNFLSGELDPRITFTRASAGTYINSSGVLTSAAIDTPRFDYDPVTLAAKGLLIEEQRTNQQLYSEDLSQWGAPANATVSTNVAVAPDGATTADKLVEDTLNASHFLSASSITHSYVSGTLYTRSCFLKASGRFIVAVYLPGATFPASSRQALFNLNTGTVYSVESGVTASIQAFGNGWYRCTITATASVTGVGHVGGSALIDDSGNGTYLGNGVSGALIWGAQMEVAAFATSYIPTTTAAATRAADVASMTGANFSNWYNQTEGTVVAESTVAQYCPAGKFGQCVWQVDDGTSNNRMHVRNDSTLTTNSFRSINVDGINAALTLGFALNVPVKTALAYKVNDFNGASSGSIGTTDTTVNPPAVNVLRLGQENAGLHLNGHIRSFKYYPTRLSNGQLQTLTK